MRPETYTSVVIIGAGPAGLAAAAELEKSNVAYELLESNKPGGKVYLAPRVDDYPNLPSTPGNVLAERLIAIADGADVVVHTELVQHLRRSESSNNFQIITNQRTIYAEAVLIAAGTRPRHLEIEELDDVSKGKILYSAVEHVDQLKDRTVAVVGGGNVALKETIYLAPLVKHLYLIHRRDEFRGFKRNVEEVKQLKNVTILTPFTPKSFYNTNLVLDSKRSDADGVILNDVDYIVMSVGQIPNTEFVEITGLCSESGYIPADLNKCTEIPGIFAAGDVLDREANQIYLSEFDGRVAAKSILKYLKN